MHPFLLLVCFNAFSATANPILVGAAYWWGKILHWSSPGFIVLEGMSSLLVAQRLGQVGRELVGQGESFQFGLLFGAAAAYVTSAWWAVTVCLIGIPSVVWAFIDRLGLLVVVISRSSSFPIDCYVAWIGLYGLPFPHLHRVCAEKNKCD